MMVISFVVVRGCGVDVSAFFPEDARAGPIFPFYFPIELVI